MKYLKDIKKLRQRIPIPLNDAIEELHEYAGSNELTDVELKKALSIIEEKFIAKAINKIAEITGASMNESKQAFIDNKLDIQKAISSLVEEQYDKNYVQIDYINKERIDLINNWLRIEDLEGFDNVLDYEFETITNFLRLFPELQIIEKAIRIAKQRKDEIFINFSNKENIEEYLIYNSELKGDEIYKKCEDDFANNIYILEKVLIRQSRNLK